MGTYVVPCNGHSMACLTSSETVTKGITLFKFWYLLLDSAYAKTGEHFLRQSLYF